MSTRIVYRKRPKYHVTAVQLDLSFKRFEYQKWNKPQVCKRGSWLVNNNGEVYTVEKDYFREHYQQVSPGVYKKIGAVWAEVATKSGVIKTKEGETPYSTGDYLVFDRAEGGDGYAIKKNVFEHMYEQINDDTSLTAEQTTYIKERIQSKIDDFKKKADCNQWRFFFWQTIAIIAAAAVPVLTGFITDGNMAFKWPVAVLGGSSAVIVGLLSLFKYQENWLRYRTTYHDLDSHLSQFNIGVGQYADKKQAFDLLAENCENILMAEVGQWAESRNAKKKHDDAYG
ncbi:MAG: DUF4231 domain-containing protein [Mariprofundaceae bacterium]|nr:DUF4231 domain-containing protein [Mariprofundaceae bacterium]